MRQILVVWSLGLDLFADSPNFSSKAVKVLGNYTPVVSKMR